MDFMGGNKKFCFGNLNFKELFEITMEILIYKQDYSWGNHKIDNFKWVLLRAEGDTN